MNIYIKPCKKRQMEKTKLVISDICEVIGDQAEEVGRLAVVVQDTAQEFLVVSALDLIKVIIAAYPQARVMNLGENHTVIEFNHKPVNQWAQIMKVVVITAIIFAGCTTAIITFHNDTQLQRIFDIYASMVGLETQQTRLWFLEIPYALGIGLGIIVFFNHLGSKKMTRDPTPIEVEMVHYESEVIDAIVDGKER